jgi:hypothetical protein
MADRQKTSEGMHSYHGMKLIIGKSVVKGNEIKFVSLQLSVEILMRGIGVGSPEKLAAAHLN